MSSASFKRNRAESRARWEAAHSSTPIPPDHPSQMSADEARRRARFRVTFGGLVAFTSDADWSDGAGRRRRFA